MAIYESYPTSSSVRQWRHCGAVSMVKKYYLQMALSSAAHMLWAGARNSFPLEQAHSW